MPLYIASLNSGSNGNCYYVGNQREAVLIDAGISCRETEKRLSRLGLSFNKIKAVFISHEHTDHTYGVEVMSRRHRLPVYISAATHENSRLKLDGNLVKPLISSAPVLIGELIINSFVKLHDASDPYSFTVTGNGITVGVFTDIGSVCDNLIHHFRQCHAAFLESNYDEVMLEEGRYPRFLKNRISSDHGHLSNLQALQLFSSHRPPFMTHLLLSHLSLDNNNPHLVLDLFKQQANGTHISIASRHEETMVFCISGNFATDQPDLAIARAMLPGQMSLF